ncbi:modulator of drug activity B [Pustulibacterium marinum]|uniref:Modulator of drug activity B n=1 Tax=Pustulibacterium marinum TaxID=1224947 RepID=A0A1I7IMU4_9FLAO|nr:NAD(P)H-dependent oxidoreductase [Pustulibacterium marinum]SFU74242.1 modulator of drug activity B [Pustulibacterium marinum]
MKKIFVINGGKKFAHSGGAFNKMLLELDKNYFTEANGFELKYTDINETYNLTTEIEKFVWADVVIYHFPAWWMGMPYALKEYIDRVFTAGHRKGMYYSDGRKAENPSINYGKGGLLKAKYMVTTTWNAPETAFTLPNEFFQQKSVDEGILFGFHRMNEFIGLSSLPSIHFHDVEKNNGEAQIALHQENYMKHLHQHFPTFIIHE